MAYFSPEEAFDTLKKRTAESVSDYFPVKGKKNTLVAKKVWVDDDKSVDDITSQQDARLKGRSWTVPVKAQVELRDSETGKVKDTKTVTVAQLPKITRRYSHVVDGNEWQINNQFRLKSGVYTRVKDNGDLSSQWNLAKGRGFSMDFDPSSKQMKLGVGTSNIPLYPVLKTMGIADDDMERVWGKEVLEVNRKQDPSRALKQMYKTLTGKSTDNLDLARKTIAEEFDKTELRPDSTKITLGSPFNKVDGSSLLAGSNKLLKVSRQEAEPDDRDSLEFKELWSAEDLIQERLAKDARGDISRRLNSNIDRKDKISDIVTSDVFNKPLKKFFTNSTFAERPDQRNPLSFLAGTRRTTTIGQHSIDSDRKISLEAQSINPSHLGFLDPVLTPESSRIGVNLQLSANAQKDGKDVKIPVLNAKTGKREMIDASKALKSVVAFPDQFEKKSGGLVPIDKQVKVSDKDGSFSVADARDVQYVLPSAKGMFDLSTNLIPFLQNDQGNRTMVAARQMEQAVPLTEREAPLVQVKGEGAQTFEGVVGKFSAHKSNVSGTVVGVNKEAIKIKDDRGKTYSVPLYDNFPLNDNKSFIDSKPLVKNGDKVQKNQIVADTSFTDNGTLALGKNLRTAYMPYKGLNFEDAIVVSESAAKKLTSENLHRQGVKQDKNSILNKKKFLAETAGQLTKEQADKLDDDAVIKPGSIVMPGDVLVGELKREELTPEQRQLTFFSRKAAKPLRARPQTWENDYPGTVAKVVKHGNNTTVYVKTHSSAEIGDKIVGRHGNKGVISAILPDAEMPRTKDGVHSEILLNQAGVPSRINLGQVLETAAGKIAQKTGKPYEVNNFDPNNKNYTKNLIQELKKHGLSDTETLFDPKTGKPYGGVLTGPQYIMKLHHAAEKKLAARSRDAYTSNLAPQAGGKHGGQTMDVSGMYALLAHGAKHNVREAQSLKSEMNDEVWERLQAGEAVPAPQVPFAYKKFESMLKGAGIDVRKEGNDLILGPLTDKGVLELSNGRIKDPGKILRAKDAQPEPGGLFDPVVTRTPGIHKMGDAWSHITLAERMPNPTFEKPIRALTGLNEKDFSAVMAGKKTLNGKTSATAIVSSLKGIDVDKELKQLENEASQLRGATLNKVNHKIRYLRALKTAGLTPKDAYTMKHVPVLPPNMRPISVMSNGDLNEADLNGLYSRGIGAANNQLEELKKDKLMPKEEQHPVTEALYDGLKALNLTGMAHKNRYRSGIVEQIAGGKLGSPKTGFFQDKIIGRRQDMSMRGTIIPEPSLNLDEAGIPHKAAAEMYKPFVMARLRRQGFSAIDAQNAVKQNNPAAQKALEAEVEERPVMLKRDPVLHKYGVQAFKPKLIKGKAIQVHPLVTGGFNADFDGNCLSGESKIALYIDNRRGTLPEVEDLMKFAGKTRVLEEREDGVVVEINIEDCPRSDSPTTMDKNGNPIYAIPDGISVLTYDHAENDVKFSPVVGLTVEDNCPVVEVKTKNFSVTASDNESLCVYDHETGEVRKAAPEDSIGAYCPVAGSIPLLPDGRYDFEVGWAIGSFVSDGFLLGDKDTIIGYSKVSVEHRDRFFAAVRSLESGTIRRATYDVTHGEDCEISGRSVKDHISGLIDSVGLWKSCYADVSSPGRRCLIKKLPGDISSFSEDCLFGILSGLLNGDGNLSWSNGKNKPQLQMQISTSSPYLVESIKELCFLLGIRCGSSSSEPKEGRLQTHTSYTVFISTVDIRRHIERLSFVGEAKKIYEEMLEEKKSGFAPKDDRDLVPVPYGILSLLASVKGPADRSMQRSLATVKSNNKKYPRISRSVALRMLEVIPQNHKDLPAWRGLVEAHWVRWESIESVEERGKIRVYDLVVPETKVFVANGGLVVWDTMSAFVPVSAAAVHEAQKMFPSNNLFSSSHGDIMYKPGHEAMHGLFKMTESGKKRNVIFDTAADAARAAQSGKIGMTDVVKIKDVKTIGMTKLAAAPVETTVGKLLVASALPVNMKKEKDKLIRDPKAVMDKKTIQTVLTTAGKEHPDSFTSSVDKLKDMGNAYATGSSISLKDFVAETEDRDAILKSIAPKVTAIQKSSLTKKERDGALLKLYDAADKEIQKRAKAKIEKSGNKMYDWVKSGARGNWDQFRQMNVAPMIVVDSQSKPVPVPITRSYGEGLDVGGYWTAMHGARMGTIGRVQGTELPGALFKEIVNTSINQTVASDDCGTNRGIAVSVDDKNALDRYLSKDVKLGTRGGKDKGVIPAGTVITPRILTRFKNNGIKEVTARTPLKCAHGEGICSKCMGLNENGQKFEKGTNVGIIAAQALGEPTTQMSMNAFHCNHSDSLVFVRRSDQVDNPFVVTFENLFEMVDGPVRGVEGDEEIKEARGWEIYDGTWVNMTHVRRHAPARPMQLVSDGGLATICQDNHPIVVWDVGGIKYLPPVELEKGKYFLRREVFPFWDRLDTEPLDIEPYLVGVFLAEGNVIFKYIGSDMKEREEKKPYTINFSQADGVVKDEIKIRMRGRWKFESSPSDIMVHNLELGTRFLQLFGQYSHKKALPPDFIWYPREWLAEVLCGLIDGAGTIERYKDGSDVIGIDTTSFALAQQVMMIGFKLGLVCSIVATTNRKLTRHQGFKVRVQMTEKAKSLLSSSLKVGEVEKLSPDQRPENFVHREVTLVRDVVYTDKFVYDATTLTGTLSVSGLKSHNTGGVHGAAGSTAVDKFKRLQSLMQLPQTVKGSAILAKASGQVDKIENDPAGGWNVYVNDKKHFVPGRRELLVKPGVPIKKGDAISSGTKNPRELLPLTGLSSVQRYLSDEMADVYGSSSPLHRRNIEVVVRSLTNLSEVQDPGSDPDLLRGDHTPTSKINAFNAKLKPGQQPVKHTPILKGTNVMPNEMQTDWLARMQTTRLKSTLLDGASKGWKSNIHGTTPIPGMAYAKEFGLGTEDAPWLY